MLFSRTPLVLGVMPMPFMSPGIPVRWSGTPGLCPLRGMLSIELWYAPPPPLRLPLLSTAPSPPRAPRWTREKRFAFLRQAVRTTPTQLVSPAGNRGGNRILSEFFPRLNGLLVGAYY
eukprot:5427826-Pyramimonas_sp.AAC.2